MLRRQGRWLLEIVILWMLMGGLLSTALGPVRTSQDVLRVRAEAALQWLQGQQAADGSFGASWGQTADAVYVIALAGENPGGSRWRRNGISALDALAAQTPDIVGRGHGGEIAKLLRAVATAGRDVHNFAGYDLVTELQRTYDSATGRFRNTNNFGQALAIQALVMAGELPPANAVASLLADQRPNGGWGWPYQGEAVDVDTTGMVLEALALANVPVGESHVQRGLAFLRVQQRADGGWPSRPVETFTNCNSTALAIRALVRYGIDPRRAPWAGYNGDGSWRDPLGGLLQFQQRDGGFQWRQDVAGTRTLSTTDALPALLLPWPRTVLLDKHTYVVRVLAP